MNLEGGNVIGVGVDLTEVARIRSAYARHGDAFLGGERMPSAEALRRAGLAPIQLEAKEGLALLNGTQVSTAVLALALAGAERLGRAADVIVHKGREYLVSESDLYEGFGLKAYKTVAVAVDAPADGED